MVRVLTLDAVPDNKPPLIVTDRFSGLSEGDELSLRIAAVEVQDNDTVWNDAVAVGVPVNVTDRERAPLVCDSETAAERLALRLADFAALGEDETATLGGDRDAVSVDFGAGVILSVLVGETVSAVALIALETDRVGRRESERVGSRRSEVEEDKTATEVEGVGEGRDALADSVDDSVVCRPLSDSEGVGGLLEGEQETVGRCV